MRSVSREIPVYNPIGREELDAAIRVVSSGKLSGFIGAWSPEFYGGSEVRSFEREIEQYFGVKHAISVNSWTSGLIAAVGALDIEPGDEVIVPTWTMSATAMAVLHWNAIPVFADIDRNTFCIDPISVQENISDRTRAVIAVDIFGQSADLDAIKTICSPKNIKIISDSAQAPGAMAKNAKAGTLADIGGFSLNYHKHINTGEGGILVTNSDYFASRLQLLRNHAESVVDGMGHRDINNMIGFNFRMGEIEAAIGREQLKKLDNLVKRRQELASQLTEGIRDLPGLETPFVMEGGTHVYYKYAMKLQPDEFTTPRVEIANLLRAEGIPGVRTQYVNVHMLPIFQKKIAYGTRGFPWNSPYTSREVTYEKGICPIAEELQEKSYLGLDICEYDFEESDIEGVISGFHKVWDLIT
jgi:perosamine synthetase